MSSGVLLEPLRKVACLSPDFLFLSQYGCALGDVPKSVISFRLVENKIISIIIDHLTFHGNIDKE